LGFSGLVGSGRSNVARCLFGLEPFDRGRVLIRGDEARIERPADALEFGLFLVPEDRKIQGLFLNRSVESNATILQLVRRLLGRFLVDRGTRRLEAERLTTELNVKYADLDQEIASLSGGNQQKVAIARGLSVTPRILILDEPTRGIDIGAKAEIHHLMNRLTHEGMAIIMISSELPEVLGMSDRIVVMREGRIAATFDREEANSEKIMLAAAGGERNVRL
ncbi:MAG TPA: D-xylose ABC transporter ATP-binding protein, partial [Synergistaceae bacterium]|nr:D-xylose ABC transporter ATP-binding protein [Synergistaceae bacterium]